ncbi:MarR family winged helix-turn-helix transcriptional regulator [Micromonospora sp. NPDC047670]|uniref:MarR family winged helix-turn-helix transcriptional regulator n=1 Tax=Micromonospora sp. NPDC047670 TaxID=3364252 RepID=UPI003719B2C4
MSASVGGVELCGLVARLNQRMDSHIRGVADALGITASQAIALREMSEPITLTELADRMSCEASNAGYVIDRMEKQGLVRRQPHPTDRRAKILTLTEDGQKCRSNVLDALSRKAPIDALSPDEQRALAELLRKATS